MITHQERGEKDQDVEDAHSFRHIRSMSDTICERLASCEHATVTFASVELIKTKRGEADSLRVCGHTYVVMDGDATLLPR